MQESLGHEVELPSFDEDSSTWERQDEGEEEEPAPPLQS